MKRILGLLGVLLLVGLAAVVVYLVRTQRPPGAMTVIESQAMDMTAMKPPEGVLPVATERVRRQSVVATLTYTGTVMAFTDEDVVARVSGRVTSLLYPGQRVAAGDVVARLDSLELTARAREARLEEQVRRAEQTAALAALAASRPQAQAAQSEARAARIGVLEAQAEVTSARAEAHYREQQLRRDEELFRQGGLSQEELERSRSQAQEARVQVHHREVGVGKSRQLASAAVNRARGEVARTQGAWAQAGAARAQAQRAGAGAEAAEITRDYTELRSLEGGEVSERLVSPGTVVMPGTVLLRIKRIDRLRLQARVPADRAAQLRPGAPVEVQLDDPRPAFSTRLTAVFPAADPGTRTVTVEAVIHNPVSRRVRLIAGEYVVMRISLGRPEWALTVPRTALVAALEGGSAVFVVRERPAPKEAATYTCVMHPEVRSDRPGKCPKCGMELVPVVASGPLYVERTPVKIGAVSGDRVAVLQGLKDGDQVVTRAPEGLRDQMAVQSVSWGPGGPAEPSPAARPTPAGHEGH